MHIYQMLKERRSIRKFRPEKIPYPTLERLVDAARVAPSSLNRQPLEYIIVDDPELEKKIFQKSSWAGHLDWSPSEEERPRAYIVVLFNKEVQSSRYEFDAGLAVGNMCSAAVEEGLGTCILGSIDTEFLRELLNVPDSREVYLAVALGYPAQKSVLEEPEEGRDPTKYWLDKKQKMHVPKRKLEDILHRNKFG